MADELVVIGKGRMIASGPVADFVKNARTGAVLVRTPQATDLAALLSTQPGVNVAPQPDGLRVTGLDADKIGDLAFDHRIHRDVGRVRCDCRAAYLGSNGVGDACAGFN